MRILLITGDVPATSSMAGSPRVFSLFKYIAQRHEVYLATFATSVWSVWDPVNGKCDAFLASEETARVFQRVNILPTPRLTSFWGRQRHRILQAPFFLTRYRSPEGFQLIQGRIRELMEESNPDLLFVDGLPAAQYILDVDLVPRVVDAHDAASLNFRRRSRYASSWVEKLSLLLESYSIRRFEVMTARTVDAYLVNSAVDQGVLHSYHREMRVSCIPNGVDTEYFAPNTDVSDERTLVFTGVMTYAPNRDAAHFFCAEILPRVRSRFPEVRVELVGSNAPDDVCSLAGNGVTVTGTVPDIRPYVHRAAVYVSPLRFGTGVKNKVLAALAMGKAVVATSESCSGLEVTPGEHLLVADTPKEFADHIVRLLTDPSRRRHLGISGRNLVLQRYGWDSIGKQLEALLERLVFGAAQP